MMKPCKNFKSYYTAQPMLSKGALFNFCVSDRSDGKSFDIKVRNIEAFDQNKSCFVYVRRYKTEITQQLYENYFDEIFLHDEYKKYKEKYTFKCKKLGIWATTDKKPNKKTVWHPIVYFIPLTQAGKLKSQIEVSPITEINFDEYIPLDGIYLKDEMLLCLELWKSIDRDRDKTKFNFFGNRVKQNCPFLNFFNISIDLNVKRNELFKNGSICIQSFASSEHRQVRAKSKFADLISNTGYAGYDAGGKLNELSITLCSGKFDITHAIPFITYIGRGSIVFDDDKCIILDKYPNNPKYILTEHILQDVNCPQLNISLYPKISRLLKEFYYNNKIYAISTKAKNNFTPILDEVIY